MTAADLYEKVLRGNKGKGVFQTASQTDDLSRALLKAGRTREALYWANKLVKAECKDLTEVLFNTLPVLG